MEITVGELQQMSGFWNEFIMQKRISDSSMGVGLGIVLFAMTVIGLFCMGTETSLFHTFVPSLFVFYGGFRIFMGAAAAKKSKSAMEKVRIFGEDKEEIMLKTLEEMVKFSGEDEDSFFLNETLGKTRGNQTILRWKGKFNGDMVTLMKEPKDEIYFLLIDELNIEVGKQIIIDGGYKRVKRKLAEQGLGEGYGTIRECKIDTSQNDHYATVRFGDREIKCEISVESIRKYEKWKKGEYPQTTENGEPFPIWTFKAKKKKVLNHDVGNTTSPEEA